MAETKELNKSNTSNQEANKNLQPKKKVFWGNVFKLIIF